MANPYINDHGVYENKLGIDNAALLDRIEYETSTIRQAEILSGAADLKVNGFGIERQKAIHQHLFGQVYGWAGKIRTIPLAKQMDNGMFSVFAAPDSIQEKWAALEVKTHEFAHADSLSFDQKREALVDIFIEANHIHAFPEGNGRCLQTFMKLLAREQGVDLEYGSVSSKRWNHASAVSGIHGEREIREGENFLIRQPQDSSEIRQIFSEMASPRIKSIKEKLIEAARGFQVRISSLGGRKNYKEALTPASSLAWSPEQERRAAGLDGIKATATGALLTFAEIGCEAIQAAGSAAKVDWRAVEDAAMVKALRDDRQELLDVFQAIAEASPGALGSPERAALRERIERAYMDAVQQPGPDAGPSLG